MAEASSSRILTSRNDNFNNSQSMYFKSSAPSSTPIPTPLHQLRTPVNFQSALHLQTPLHLHTPGPTHTPLPSVMSRIPVSAAPQQLNASQQYLQQSQQLQQQQQQIQHSQSRQSVPYQQTTTPNYHGTSTPYYGSSTPVQQHSNSTPFQGGSSSYQTSYQNASSPYQAASPSSRGTPFLGTSQFQHFSQNQILAPSQQSVPYVVSSSPSVRKSISFQTNEPLSQASIAAAEAVIEAASRNNAAPSREEQLHNSLQQQQQIQHSPSVHSRPMSQMSRRETPVQQQQPQQQQQQQQHRKPQLTPFQNSAQFERLFASSRPNSQLSLQSSASIQQQQQQQQQQQRQQLAGSPIPQIQDGGNNQLRPQLILDGEDNSRKWNDKYEQYRVKQYDVYHITIKGEINELEFIPVKNNEFNVLVN